MNKLANTGVGRIKPAFGYDPLETQNLWHIVRQTRQMTPKKLVPDFIFKDECYAIMGACFEVYKDKGCGF